MRIHPPGLDSTAGRTMSAAIEAPIGSDIVARIRNEFREMPGLCLTSVQARRLWCLDEPTCTRVLSTLVAEGYLRRSSIGYIKA